MTPPPMLNCDSCVEPLRKGAINIASVAISKKIPKLMEEVASETGS